MRPYWEMKGFENLYLEDSFVLDVLARPGSVMFEVEIVLREDHPAYQPPAPNEQYCYRRGRIIFEEVERMAWRSIGIKPARDVTGSIDFGGFDDFRYNDSTFVIEGDFGTLDLVAASCRAELDE